MMKYLTHCLAVLFFLLAATISAQDVKISMDHPDKVNAGEDFTVSVTISKGSLTDYSRFSQDLPLGLTATNESSPNADFSFDNQRIRIIWLKLPEAQDITISYLVSVDSRLKGSFRLGGVFAYVVEDERKFLNFEQEEEITIVPSSSMDPELIVDIKEFKGGAAPVAAATTGAATTTTTAAVAGAAEAYAQAIRQKPVLLDNGGYKVHLLISNPTGSKYAKIEENIPSGYLFEELSSNDGIVSHAASTVKFIWMKMPETAEFEVSYRLVPKQNEPQSKMAIKGTLTYTSGNENKVSDIVEVDAGIDKFSSAQKRNLLATGVLPEAPKTEAPKTEAPLKTVVPPKPEEKPVSTSSFVGTSSARVIVNTKVLEPGNGNAFRVQLTANRQPIDANDFFRQSGIDREILVEQHEGLYKYTVGSFTSYGAAVSYRDKVEGQYKVKGAFVVGYHNGKRVSASSIR